MPIPVPGLAGVTALSAGGLYTCALTNAGTVECWGANGVGGSSKVPVAIPGVSGVTAVSANDDHVCVLLAAGTVECWGSKLGNGTMSNSPIPVQVLAPL